MRWPFGPPHLTLKPSKKNKTKKQKKNKTKNNTKKTKKKKNQERKRKKHKNTKKRAFQLSVKILFFYDRVSKNCLFLTPWPRKRAPKNTIKIGVSACFFLERSYASRNGHFWTKKTQIRNSSYHFFSCLFSLSKTKNTKICRNPYFYSVLANLKKIIFQKLT